MIDWEKPLRTKDGLPVRILDSRFGDWTHPMVLAAKRPDGLEVLLQTTRDGKCCIDPKLPNRCDIENVPEPVTMWTNAFTYAITSYQVMHTLLRSQQTSLPVQG